MLNANAVVVLKWNDAFEVPDARVEQRPRGGAAGVVHDDVDAAELLDGSGRERDEVVGVVRVGGDHERPPTEPAHLLGDDVELLLGAGRQHEVGAGLGERQRGGGADAPSGAGDDGDLSVDAKAFEHARNSEAESSSS